MKTLQDFIFGKEFQDALKASAGKAAAESDAVGLPRSYLYSYDELPEFLAQLRKRNSDKPTE
jgi:hypothetical protein